MTETDFFCLPHSENFGVSTLNKATQIDSVLDAESHIPSVGQCKDLATETNSKNKGLARELVSTEDFDRVEHDLTALRDNEGENKRDWSCKLI